MNTKPRANMQEAPILPPVLPKSGSALQTLNTEEADSGYGSKN